MKSDETADLQAGPLPFGQQVTGRLHFDVRNGRNSDSVVGRDAGGTGKVVRKGR